jgi:hypothetical protein
MAGWSSLNSGMVRVVGWVATCQLFGDLGWHGTFSLLYVPKWGHHCYDLLCSYHVPVTSRPVHVLFFCRFNLHSFFIHGLQLLYCSFSRFSGSLII